MVQLFFYWFSCYGFYKVAINSSVLSIGDVTFRAEYPFGLLKNVFKRRIPGRTGVAVPVSVRICRIWDRHSNGPGFSLVANIVSVSNTSIILICFLFRKF